MKKESGEMTHIETSLGLPGDPSVVPGFPEVIDSTMLNTFRACPEQFKWNYVRRLRRGTSIDLIAGGAFAKGLEVARKAFWEKGCSPEDSMAVGLAALWRAYADPEVPEKKRMKSWERVSAAFAAYFERWPLGVDYLRPLHFEGRYCIEFTFAIPLEVNHPVTGNPLIFAGRADQIVLYNGTPFCEDEKTRKYISGDFGDEFTLRAQFLGYAWAARQMGYPVQGTIVRGIALKLTDIDLAEAICYAEDWKLDRWYVQTILTLRRMVRCYGTGYWDFNLGDTCTSWNGCQYKFLCSKQDPEPWIEGNYEPNDWNPLWKEGE
jgi:hypothetical protein